MTPENQHIGVRQHLFGQAMLRHVKGGGPNLYVLLLSQKCCDTAMDSLGIVFPYRFILSLMLKLIPDRHSDHNIILSGQGVGSFIFPDFMKVIIAMKSVPSILTSSSSEKLQALVAQSAPIP